MKTIDMSGMKIGRLTVLRASEAISGRAAWVCVCACGTEKLVIGKHLREGKVVSCGCKKKERRVSDEDKAANRKIYARENAEASRIASRAYIEKNKVLVREKNRTQAAEYRRRNASLGIIASIRNVGDFWSRVYVGESDTCWNWAGAKTNSGYGVYAPMPGVLLRSHRVAYALHNEGIDDDLLVCHTCDNPSCCNPQHLFIGTPKDNMTDMISKGRKVVLRGENNPMSKLSDVQVREIFQDPRTNTQIANEYGISSSLASLIRRRKIWAEATANLQDVPARKTGPRKLQALSTI